MQGCDGELVARDGHAGDAAGAVHGWGHGWFRRLVCALSHVKNAVTFPTALLRLRSTSHDSCNAIAICTLYSALYTLSVVYHYHYCISTSQS